MSTPPPGQPGYLSPDGMWMWDGQRWVPTGAQGRPAVRRSRAWIPWLAGGCAVLVLIGIAGGIYGLVSVARTFQGGGFSCLPSDFPKYPNASLTGLHTFYGGAAPRGDTHECDETFDSNDSVSTVADFYKSQLSAGDWTVTKDDTANGRIDFARDSRPQTQGQIALFGRGDHCAFVVKLYS